MYRSHRTQELQNYYDQKDTRVRKNPVCLDAQLLNAVAIQLDDSNQRLERERAALFLPTTPIRLDNRGLYYAVRMTNDFLIPDDLTKLQVTADGTILAPFDDRLPVPVGLAADGSIVSLTDPIIMDVTGTGDDVNQIWDVKVQTLTDPLGIPNKLTFWVDGIGVRPSSVAVLVEGEVYPRPAWANQRKQAAESLTLPTQGQAATKFIWELVTRITVTGLPSGARLRCWSIPFNLPACLDSQRPYTHPTFRDVQFDRYWQIAPLENLVKETYNPGNYSDLEYVESFSCSPMLDLAVEPGTWGIFGATKSSLLYWDRRAPMPNHLDEVALTAEPLFGLHVEYDPQLSGQTRYVSITPEPYARASSLFESRYILRDPHQNLFALLPDGSLVPYTGGAGWQRGAPQSLKMPLADTGTYVITLECMDKNGVLSYDSFPYANFALAPLSAISVSQLVPEIKGIAFDSLERLWIWDGDFAIPVKVLYKAFIYDDETRTIYLTDPATSVTVANVT